MDNPKRQMRIVPLHESSANVSEGKMSTTAEERVQMMWPLALAAWAFQGVASR
jgi:hypothetical protein